ncbi:hypothetical protein [Novosphingobium sp. KACC 22771]|uniref:hypothetical protein n=1 Tax=Novosphingobium sp. KACC 22771 TaxID=3025670 RepID=UPI00236579DD|nr:hypothetical protein [Novosphingobium sp. KACC 22771]WDF72778.1 hypothetical protein PQ467_01685 [Novosphingobium sp. KACC 22771]
MRLSHMPLLLIPLLAACGEQGPVASTPRAPAGSSRPAVPVAPRRQPVPNAVVHSAPGLEGVIGARQGDLARLFGPPRLDVMEGDARKLQFVGSACVLDVYLYPQGTGGEVRATYVDARRSTDARDVDRAACVAALRRK